MNLDARGLARVFLLGAVLGSVADGFHTYGGATRYATTIGLRMAWWTPLLFGLAYVTSGALYARAARVDDARPRLSRAVAGYAAFSALYFSSGFLPAPNAVKLVVLLAGAAALFALVDRSRAAIVTACAAAVIGPSFEIALVHLGAFRHLGADFAGIPMWLPGLYFASGPGLGPLAATLLDGPADRPRATGLAPATAPR
jgi:hypothetical protein